MTHPRTSQPVAKEQGVSTREVIIPHAAKRSGGSRPASTLRSAFVGADKADHQTEATAGGRDP